MLNFQILEQIGVGSFGKVYKAKRKQDGLVYAVKLMRLSHMLGSDKNNCLNEVRMLSKINHPNIISYKETFMEGDELCLVMEWAQKGDFKQLMHRRHKSKEAFSQEEICAFGREMANGLAALHKMKIIHRDVKPDNFFICQNDCIKLGDMNVSSISRNGMASSKMGTPYYTSPEIWMEKDYSTAADIWSLGCILYQMVSMKLPFTGKDISELKEVTIRGQYKPLPLECPDQLVKIIKGCLTIQSSHRLTASQLINNDYLKRKYKEYKLKTMQKDPVNGRQRALTCARLLKEISLGSTDLGLATLPPSKYLSKEKADRQDTKRGRSITPRIRVKKGVSQKMRAVLQIYNQTSLLQRGNLPPRARMPR